jgi:hypothetical protein
MPLLKENNSSTALNNVQKYLKFFIFLKTNIQLIERDIRRIAEMSTFDIRQNDIVVSAI